MPAARAAAPPANSPTTASQPSTGNSTRAGQKPSDEGEHHKPGRCSPWSSPPTAPHSARRDQGHHRCWPFRLGSTPPDQPTAGAASSPDPGQRCGTGALHADELGRSRRERPAADGGARRKSRLQAPGPCRSMITPRGQHDGEALCSQRVNRPGNAAPAGNPQLGSKAGNSSCESLQHLDKPSRK